MRHIICPECGENLDGDLYCQFCNIQFEMCQDCGGIYEEEDLNGDYLCKECEDEEDD